MDRVRLSLLRRQVRELLNLETPELANKINAILVDIDDILLDHPDDFMMNSVIDSMIDQPEMNECDSEESDFEPFG